MQIGSCVVAAADPEMRFDINRIDLVPILVEFMLTHPQAACCIVPHAVMHARILMVESTTCRAEVADGIVRPGNMEGTPHAQVRVGFGDFLVTACATRIIHVSVGDQCPVQSGVFLAGEGSYPGMTQPCLEKAGQRHGNQAVHQEPGCSSTIVYSTTYCGFFMTRSIASLIASSSLAVIVPPSLV